MKVEIKGSFRDVLSFVAHLKKRKKIFKKADASPVERGRMNLLAEELHPEFQRFTLESVIDETPDTRTYRLKGEGRKPAYFQPGQYISINFRIGNSTLARPFSISSRPEEALEEGYYDITVKSCETEGFVDEWIRENWLPGREISSSGPAGTFTWERLRDSKLLICIAGGSGITPFKPMIPALLFRDPAARVILFQGARNRADIIFNSFWAETNRFYGDRFIHVPVLTEPGKGWGGESGFISGELIRGAVARLWGSFDAPAYSYFICGPEGLHSFMEKELSPFNLPGRRIRREEYAINVRRGENFISGNPDLFSFTVIKGGEEFLVKADPNETVLVAMERAGLKPPSLCRSGECGWCRSRLISGVVSEANRTGERSGLRKADDKFGYFHPCSVFPEGDLVIEVPSNPVKDM
ncbi:MAG: iron-sulfur cluster-binding domain-containing protein [Spirochaetales bacterium]|nr:iron-sulfur cluster-binding domain-containing protein [Spirochaetales bacterium]